ncbi:TAP42-like protein [Moelleriella libera RCEF 2490]|uniref:TAP42-like protein n=1 Tax=Moelleriella libera RCEF 2490 TaxID=1081109 RepID=A0A168BGI3_9HYPO|nr:TAP42-like protein [Moelleriella libera RCEF 2490]
MAPSRESSTQPPQSLRKALHLAESRRAALEQSSPDATSPSYAAEIQSLLAQFTALLDQMRSLALFSPNETLEDVPTSSLPYMSIHHSIAEVVQRTPFTGPSERGPVLRAARDAYERFLALLESYGLVEGPYARLLERYRDDPDKFSLLLAAAGGGQTDRRAAKVASYQAEKALREKLAFLRSNPAYRDAGEEEDDDEGGGGGGGGDEEVVREVYLSDLAYRLHKTFDALDSLNKEEEILAMAPAAAAAAPPPSSTSRPPNSQAQRRERDADEEDVSATRLDQPLRSTRHHHPGGPLLSRQGKPLQPFTLVGSRAEIARGVFRPGHNLPTMSIDEYLAEEKRQGNILQGGTDPPRQVLDEDDMAAVDRETYKAREWDDYKDDHRRGAGNTLNMG